MAAKKKKTKKKAKVIKKTHFVAPGSNPNDTTMQVVTETITDEKDHNKTISIESVKITTHEKVEDVKEADKPEEENQQEEKDAEVTIPAEVEEEAQAAEKEEVSWDEREKGDSFFKKIFVFLSIVVFCIVVGFGGAYLYIQREEQINANKESQDSFVTQAPGATFKTKEPSSKTVDKAKYKIQVLNGSGIAGIAAAVEKLLEDDGFTVVEIGNADDTTYDKTEIKSKKDIDSAYLGELKTVLEKSYVVTESSDEPQGNNDVIIIVGSEKAN